MIRLNKKLLEALMHHRDVIAKERDSLRDILDDFPAVCEATDAGLESLNYAIEQFSEQV